MGESTVEVTTGTGKKLHSWARTIGANTVEDEVGVNGEQYLATYTVAHGPASMATANSHITQIMAGASLKVRIRRIRVWQFAPATTATVGIWELYRLTTAGTGGTAITPSALDTLDAASGATAMTLPTAKGTEGARIETASCYVIQTVGASTPFNGPMIDWDFDRLRTKPLIIQAGTSNGIAVKNTTGAAAGQVMVTILFDESSFA